MAVAYFHKGELGPKETATVVLKTGELRSSYARESSILDGNVFGKYWSSIPEMSARAFQSYLEDKLASQGRKNDYLSVYADNKFHVDPLFGEMKPYPEGEERTQINAAFDALFEVIRNEKVFENAVNNQALMDSIFGNQESNLTEAQKSSLLLRKILSANGWATEKRVDGYQSNGDKKIRTIFSSNMDNYFIEIVDLDEDYVAEIGNCVNRTMIEIIDSINGILGEETDPINMCENQPGFDSWLADGHYEQISIGDMQQHPLVNRLKEKQPAKNAPILVQQTHSGNLLLIVGVKVLEQLEINGDEFAPAIILDAREGFTDKVLQKVMSKYMGSLDARVFAADAEQLVEQLSVNSLHGFDSVFTVEIEELKQEQDPVAVLRACLAIITQMDIGVEKLPIEKLLAKHDQFIRLAQEGKITVEEWKQNYYTFLDNIEVLQDYLCTRTDWHTRDTR